VIVDTREAIKEIGYNDSDRRFNAAGASVRNLFSRQAAAASASAFTFLFRDSSPSDLALQVSEASATVNLLFASTSDAYHPIACQRD
jgi:hypothetical protein